MDIYSRKPGHSLVKNKNISGVWNRTAKICETSPELSETDSELQYTVSIGEICRFHPSHYYTQFQASIYRTFKYLRSIVDLPNAAGKVKFSIYNFIKTTIG